MIVHHSGQAEVFHQLLLALQPGVAAAGGVELDPWHSNLEALVQRQDILRHPEVHEGEATMNVTALVKGHVEERVTLAQAEMSK
eukprot:CAMPEP_0115262560 /NCGR_PEP_ID=MMETSP0270-20121206/49448_1 /TAXON_ID=71861 /ORGANISM="Scrippsiella trochoidea, Strain CCMP3099" /LENGTH=83 /DNA_ID=CAMNT_0002678495 /DNA_START=174 /DNA_END=426 /DNA_ORIENTATION=+